MQIILTESYLTGTSSTTLAFISLLAIFFSIAIIVSKNPILSVLFLIALFFAMSIYLITIGLQFLGLVYLIVYVGAVSILFLFILMLINVRISELLTDNNNSVFLAVLTILCFTYTTQDILPSSFSTYNVINTEPIIEFIYNSNSLPLHVLYGTNNFIFYIFKYLMYVNITVTSSKSWDGLLVTLSHVASIGNILYTNLVILFIITSLILLLAMIGAIIITINKTKKSYN